MKKLSKGDIRDFVIVPLSVLGIFAGVSSGLNYWVNDKFINNPSYSFSSEPVFPWGHTEHIIYKNNNGSQELKIFPRFNGYTHSEILTDVDGDNKVDRIETRGINFFEANKLISLLVREKDYEDSKEEFDRADKQLGDSAKKHNLIKLPGL